MHLPVLLAAASLVQAGWRVEEAPLAEAGWEVRHAASLDGETVAAIAVQDPRDGGVVRSAIFATRIGEAPQLLGSFVGEVEDATGSGTGFTASARAPDAGTEVFRVRWQKESPELVSLGAFRQVPRAVSCDDAVADCAVIDDDGVLSRWQAGTTTRLIEPSTDDLHPWGVAMRGRGGALAIALDVDALVMTFEPPKVVVVRGAVTQTARTLGELYKRLEHNLRWARAGDTCKAIPQGWNGEKVHILLTDHGEVAPPPCLVNPDDFELDLKTLRRAGLPPYPWQPLDCPQGGWTSKLGSFVTHCDTVADMMKGHPKLEARDATGNLTFEELDRSPEGSHEVPEAVALSERQIFVMALTKTDFFWFRGQPKGDGLKFVLEGPSVVTFMPRGVTVERVDWKFGNAEFGDSLVDDWHLISPSRENTALVRLVGVP
jgi:hypothetical protein